MYGRSYKKWGNNTTNSKESGLIGRHIMIGRQVMFKKYLEKKMNSYQLVAYTFIILFIGFFMGYYA